MGKIGRWIDERCVAEPDVMREVMKRRWNKLVLYIERDARCAIGCMIGTYVLVKHPYAESPLGFTDSETYWIGCGPGSVLAIRCRLGAPRTIALLKQRIRKSLGLAPHVESVQETAAV